MLGFFLVFIILSVKTSIWFGLYDSEDSTCSTVILYYKTTDGECLIYDAYENVGMKYNGLIVNKINSYSFTFSEYFPSIDCSVLQSGPSSQIQFNQCFSYNSRYAKVIEVLEIEEEENLMNGLAYIEEYAFSDNCTGLYYSYYYNPYGPYCTYMFDHRSVEAICDQNGNYQINLYNLLRRLPWVSGSGCGGTLELQYNGTTQLAIEDSTCHVNHLSSQNWPYIFSIKIQCPISKPANNNNTECPGNIECNSFSGECSEDKFILSGSPSTPSINQNELVLSGISNYSRSVFLKQKYNFCHDFNVSFTYETGDWEYLASNIGFGFMIQNIKDDYLGSNKYYGTDLTLSNAFTVLFVGDTYGPPCAQPMWFVNGGGMNDGYSGYPCCGGADNGNLVSITYNSASKNLVIDIDFPITGGCSNPNPPINIDLGSLLGGCDAWMGFVSGTNGCDTAFRCDGIKINSFKFSSSNQCKPICDPTCSVHGTCVNRTCTCESNWTGDDCSNQVIICDPICSVHGTCVNGTCSCDSNWTGDDCSNQDPIETETCSISCPSFTGRCGTDKITLTNSIINGSLLLHGSGAKSAFFKEKYDVCQDFTINFSYDAFGGYGFGFMIQNNAEDYIGSGSYYGTEYSLLNALSILFISNEYYMMCGAPEEFTVNVGGMNQRIGHCCGNLRYGSNVTIRYKNTTKTLEVLVNFPTYSCSNGLLIINDVDLESILGSCMNWVGFISGAPYAHSKVTIKSFEFCGIKRCDPPCSVHGTCVNGTCSCYPGWTGYDCSNQVIICDPVCSVHGTCINGTCLCKNSSWTGDDCSNQVIICDPVCSVHGTCINGTCLCKNSSWTGEDCSNQVIICDPVCSVHGTCVNGVCSCEPGWTTDDCSVPQCLNPVCKEDEICTEPNVCQKKADCFSLVCESFTDKCSADNLYFDGSPASLISDDDSLVLIEKRSIDDYRAVTAIFKEKFDICTDFEMKFKYKITGFTDQYVFFGLTIQKYVDRSVDDLVHPVDFINEDSVCVMLKKDSLGSEGSKVVVIDGKYQDNQDISYCSVENLLSLGENVTITYKDKRLEVITDVPSNAETNCNGKIVEEDFDIEKLVGSCEVWIGFLGIITTNNHPTVEIKSFEFQETSCDDTGGNVSAVITTISIISILLLIIIFVLIIVIYYFKKTTKKKEEKEMTNLKEISKKEEKELVPAKKNQIIPTTPKPNQKIQPKMIYDKKPTSEIVPEVEIVGGKEDTSFTPPSFEDFTPPSFTDVREEFKHENEDD